MRKGLLLLDAIERTREVSWDDKGETTIMGDTIEASNIVDLINFTVRNVKQPYPVGFEKYKNWLLNSSIPPDLIMNATLKNPTSSRTVNSSRAVNSSKTKRRSRRIQRNRDQYKNLQNLLEIELAEASTPRRSRFSPIPIPSWNEY